MLFSMWFIVGHGRSTLSGVLTYITQTLHQLTFTTIITNVLLVHASDYKHCMCKYILAVCILLIRTLDNPSTNPTTHSLVVINTFIVFAVCAVFCVDRLFSRQIWRLLLPGVG